MKKILLGLLAGFVLASSVPVSFAAFDDVYSSHANLDAITYVQEQGIVDGYPDGTYKPDQSINRAEFTKIIVGAALNYNSNQDPSGYDIYAPVGLSFSDIEDGAWYIPYLRKAVENEIISGYPDGTFKPSDNINFVEAAKILVKGFDLEVYSDEETWFRPYVEVLEGQKAIPSTIKSFEHKVTRGEMAEMIYRLKENVMDKASLTYEDLAGCEETCAAPDYSSYLEWVLPDAAFAEPYGKDCVGVMASWTFGGDLLSTLIADPDTRSRMDLELYTPVYLVNLEATIVEQTHSLWDKDFYAHYVCNLGPSGDIAAGYLFPRGQSATEGADEFEITGNLSFDDMVVVSVHGDDVDFYDDLQMTGGTATGAEPPICTADAIMNGFTWSCFLSLHVDDEDGVDGSNMRYTNILFDGSAPFTWEDVEYNQ